SRLCSMMGGSLAGSGRGSWGAGLWGGHLSSGVAARGRERLGFTVPSGRPARPGPAPRRRGTRAPTPRLAVKDDRSVAGTIWFLHVGPPGGKEKKILRGRHSRPPSAAANA